MAAERSSSEGSSIRDQDSLDGNEKVGHDSYVKVAGDDELERGDVIPVVAEKAAAPPATSMRSAVVWMIVNTLATIGIVSHVADCAF